MASREYHAALESFPKGIAVPGDSYEDVRRKFAPAHGHDPGPDIETERVRVGGVGGVWVRRKGEKAERTLYFVHGGALVSCPADTYPFYAAWFVREARAQAFLVDYRLAPEHRFPAALDDCVEGYRALLAAGVDPKRVAFMGDSCGGGLAVASLVRLRDLGERLPACAVALSGWFDLEASGESATNPVGEDRFVNPVWIRERGRDYVGPTGDPADPFASPIHADLHGLPPLLLQAGQIDVTRDDAVRLAARAGRAGTSVTLEIWADMVHGWQGMQGFCPEAAWAVQHASAFVRRYIP
jgi:acetyl esterase/lipase